MKTNSAITRDRLTRWRAVDLRTTIKVAHACTSGVDYARCSKKDIYKTFMKPEVHTYAKPQVELFAWMMDEMVEIHNRHRRLLDTEIHTRVEGLKVANNFLPTRSVSTLAMTSGGENRHPKIIHRGMIKTWVGIGWVDSREALIADYKELPVVHDE